jgi:hypothetical protein
VKLIQGLYEAAAGHRLFTPLLIAGFALLAVWILPKLSVKRLGTLNEKERFDCENESRKTIAQVIGGVLLLAGLYFTAETLWINQETLRATQERQITELYARAVEQMGHNSLQIRLGGIYALERVAAESPRYQGIVIEVLSAFVRDRAGWDGNNKPLDPNWLKRRVAVDITAAVATLVRSRPYRVEFVQTKAPCKSPGDELYFDDGCLIFSGLPPNVHGDEALRRSVIDLSATNLTGLLIVTPRNLSAISFTHSNLERSVFSDSQLVAVWAVGSRLVDAQLENVRLNLSNLNGTDFERANLRGADLRRASLRNAVLRGADLTGAQLRGVDLTTVIGLTRKQIASAITDQTTRLPDYLR